MFAGIMPITTYGGFKRMTGFCKTKIPKEVEDTLERIKGDEEAVKVAAAVHAVLTCARRASPGASPAAAPVTRAPPWCRAGVRH